MPRPRSAASRRSARRYLTFDFWYGMLNNTRMCFETVLVLSILLKRRLVIRNLPRVDLRVLFDLERLKGCADFELFDDAGATPTSSDGGAGRSPLRIDAE